MVQFFIGMDHPANAWPFLRCMISANTLRHRKGPFRVNQWILDSGAFTELSTHGRWRTSPKEYAGQINRWKTNGNLVAAVTQDLMCEPFLLQKIGLTIEDHQKITVDRYSIAYRPHKCLPHAGFAGLRASIVPRTPSSLWRIVRPRSVGWCWKHLQTQR